MFQNITEKDVKFPQGFPDDAAAIVTALLAKDPEKRLGWGDDDAAFKNHEYFKSIDWDKLLKKEIKPPYKPTVKSAKDTKYVHKAYLEAPVVDSAPGSDIQLGEEGYDQDKHFDGFEFSGALDAKPAAEEVQEQEA